MKTAQHKTVNRSATVQPAASPKVVQRKAVAATMPVSIQTSMKVSSPHDPAEKEAESTTKKIMRMTIPEGSIAAVRTPGGEVYRKIKEEQKQQPKLHAKFVSPYISRFAGTGVLTRRDIEKETLQRKEALLPEEKIQRKAEGQPDVSANIAAESQNSLSGGKPLPLGVRRFMEPRFKADFSNVKIHTSDKSAKLNRQLNAHAFATSNHIFFGKNKFQPETDDGKELIAHELTHTIQQGGAVQRKEDATVTQRTQPMVHRGIVNEVLDYFADKAYNIPGFRMFTIIIGFNPINMNRADRSAANILRAIIEFLPGGNLITQALDNHGVFDKVGAWVEKQFAALASIGASFKQALDDFIDSLGWRDVLRLGSVWSRAKALFTNPIDTLINFAKGLFNGIIKFIKDAILRPLAKLAEGTRAFDLLCAVLGENPITGDKVPQTADTIIGGFMKMIGQEEIWNNIKKANAIPRAWAWFKTAMNGLMGLVRSIPGRFINVFTSLTIMDIVLVPRAFAKVVSVFAGIAGDFISWAGGTIWSLLEIIFAVVAPGAVPYLKKAAATFRTILKNPIGFIGNLVRAGIMGFKQFVGNFLKHLKTSLVQWLTGTLPGIYIPQSFSLGEIIKFVLSVLGLTWANIRVKLVKVVGDTAVKAMETGFDIVVTLVTQGPAAAWEKIKEGLSNLKEMVIDGVMDFVKTKVVEAAITKLLTSLNPAGAFIQAIIAIYNTIMFFIERLKQIAQVAMSFIDAISAIAAGVLKAAADRVETTMAGLLTLVISFLARIAGLGKVSDAVMGIINKVRTPIDKALDRVVDWIVAMAKKAGRFVASTAKKLVNWWKLKTTIRTDEGESHSLYFSGEGKAAKLIVASAPTAAKSFIDSKREEAKKDDKKKAAIGAIEGLIKEVEKFEAYPEDKYEDAQKGISAAMNAMRPHLIALLSESDWGSEANPLPLEYTKRRAGSYPLLYIGPRSESRIPQSLLATGVVAQIEKLLSVKEKKAWQDKGQKFQRYGPYEQKALPDGGATVGISDAYKIEVGKKLLYKPGSTAGGGLINQALAPYGYRARAEGKDGDHIVEMQIGGPNILPNLWPLDKGENRSSGAALAAKRMKKPDGKEISMSEANSKRKNKLWLIISKTL